MFLTLQTIPFAFAALFPVVNPIGSSVIFLSLTKGARAAEQRVLAWRVALYTFLMLTIVFFVGSWVLRIFGISVPIVLIGGGLVISYIGWEMLNQAEGTHKTSLEKQCGSYRRMAFYPLTMPVTAGPGSIAVAITLGAHSVSGDWAQTAGVDLGSVTGLFLIALVVYFCYRYANSIVKKLGATGAEVLMRLAAFINLCIGLQILWRGVSLLLKQ